MKKIGAFIVLILIGLVFVSAVAEPTIEGVGEEDVEAIQGAVENIPINPETGEVDMDRYKPFKTKADERIAAINNYVGPITKVLFGVELTLSWIFIFSVILWILLIEIILAPISQIFDYNFWGSFFGSAIIATLAMQGFGKDFVIWINSLVTQWYIGIIVIIFASVFYVVYSMIMKAVGKNVKKGKEGAAKVRTREDRAVIHANRKVAEQELKEYSD